MDAYEWDDYDPIDDDDASSRLADPADPAVSAALVAAAVLVLAATVWFASPLPQRLRAASAAPASPHLAVGLGRGIVGR